MAAAETVTMVAAAGNKIKKSKVFAKPAIRLKMENFASCLPRGTTVMVPFGDERDRREARASCGGRVTSLCRRRGRVSAAAPDATTYRHYPVLTIGRRGGARGSASFDCNDVGSYVCKMNGCCRHGKIVCRIKRCLHDRVWLGRKMTGDESKASRTADVTLSLLGAAPYDVLCEVARYVERDQARAITGATTSRHRAPPSTDLLLRPGEEAWYGEYYGRYYRLPLETGRYKWSAASCLARVNVDPGRPGCARCAQLEGRLRDAMSASQEDVVCNAARHKFLTLDSVKEGTWLHSRTHDVFKYGDGGSGGGGGGGDRDIFEITMCDAENGADWRDTTTTESGEPVRTSEMIKRVFRVLFKEPLRFVRENKIAVDAGDMTVIVGRASGEVYGYMLYDTCMASLYARTPDGPPAGLHVFPETHYQEIVCLRQLREHARNECAARGGVGGGGGRGVVTEEGDRSLYHNPSAIHARQDYNNLSMIHKRRGFAHVHQTVWRPNAEVCYTFLFGEIGKTATKEFMKELMHLTFPTGDNVRRGGGDDSDDDDDEARFGIMDPQLLLNHFLLYL